jgi:hypothetical protein
MSGQALSFIAVFLIILFLFIAFVRFVARRFSTRIDPKTYDGIERIMIGGIIAGVIAMFQPWIFAGYKYGFLLLLFSTLTFIVWSHVTPSAPLYGEEEFTNISAQQAVRNTTVEQSSSGRS